MKILLIEDEIPAARQLTKMLAEYRPAWHIADTLDSVSGAVRWLHHFPTPDLIFMDIQIADGLSFDIFRQVEVASPVIFTTAFDQYAVRAFKVNAVDYLLKPIEPEELNSAILKLEKQQAQPAPDFAALTRLFEKPDWKDRFLIKNGQQFIFLPTQDIACFCSSEGLTFALTTGGKKHFIDNTLDELERLLDPARFFRISRNMMVSPECIRKISAHFNGRLKLDLLPATSEEVLVSRERVGDFKAWLGG